jgi:hypothetical protein
MVALALASHYSHYPSFVKEPGVMHTLIQGHLEDILARTESGMMQKRVGPIDLESWIGWGFRIMKFYQKSLDNDTGQAHWKSHLHNTKGKQP